MLAVGSSVFQSPPYAMQCLLAPSLLVKVYRAARPFDSLTPLRAGVSSSPRPRSNLLLRRRICNQKSCPSGVSDSDRSAAVPFEKEEMGEETQCCCAQLSHKPAADQKYQQLSLEVVLTSLFFIMTQNAVTPKCMLTSFCNCVLSVS